MEQPISSAEANRSFSALLREVRLGRSFVVTSHGRPVARLAPADQATTDHAAARAHLFDHLRRLPLSVAGWSRDELYD